MAAKNRIIIVNKHYNNAEKVSLNSFSKDETYRKGEVIVSNDPDAPGLFIYVDGEPLRITNQKFLSEMSDYQELMAKIAESGKVQSVNGMSGDVSFTLDEIEGYEELSGLVASIKEEISGTVATLQDEVDKIKERGIPEETIDDIKDKVSSDVLSQIESYVNQLVEEKIKKQQGHIALSEAAYNKLRDENKLDPEVFYYVYEGDAPLPDTGTTGSTGTSVDIEDGIITFDKAEVSEDGVLVIDGEVVDGVLILDIEQGGSTIPGITIEDGELIIDQSLLDEGVVTVDGTVEDGVLTINGLA